ncbi:MAG: hypothetical protein QM691_00475 [Opitutaceae bacterium]
MFFAESETISLRARGEQQGNDDASAAFAAGAHCSAARRVRNLLGRVGIEPELLFTGCPYNSIIQQVEREHFKALGIPLIALETSVHREPPTEEQLIKLRTFVEMLT